MTFPSESLLEKYARQNYLDKTWGDFERALERGEIRAGEIPPSFTYGSECVTCEEKTIKVKYRGRTIDTHIVSGTYILHQCPQYVDECWPDDPEVRDGSGNLRTADWSDDTDRVRDYSDDPYDPTEGCYPVPYGGYNG